MLYIDTSVLVAALTAEARSSDIQIWLSEQSPGELAISDWTITEFSSALSIKMRTGQLALDQRNRSLAGFSRLISESFDVFSISAFHFRAAARLADRFSLNLRAGDALHVTIALEHGATLCTLDQRLAAAGPEIGAATMLL
ncbi:type II toxin-antitoxin system VapC family toxin [Pararhizobium antarcticum]|uniref:Ribonuclease VapC n=1 Tax=Pararhizobium antarcticum TaxID=1798805 RepID=A0A657M084_9HYPH|nr:type II toxin-antitoxin system VapC family toxin [Pararhizobium antarcticum]OJG00113.1 twitching motility protein PilT [Rhizobium sp. 58]OJG01484.1 twitching motility protein PilT [Pararhizobium antarcticum]